MRIAEQRAREYVPRVRRFYHSRARYGYLGDALVKVNPPAAGTSVRAHLGSKYSRPVNEAELHAGSEYAYRSRRLTPAELFRHNHDYRSRRVNTYERMYQWKDPRSRRVEPDN
jgi:hypothetical protein